MINNLMIAIPTLDYIHRKFVESLTGLIQRLGDMDCEYEVCFEGCTLVYISRDNLVKKAIYRECDWVLWLDADMVFEPDIFEKLRDTDKEFVSGIYRGRHNRNMPCAFDSLFPSKRWDEKRYSKAKALEKIAGCGMGCALTKTEILNYVMKQYGTCFTPTMQLGEDLAFCHRVSEIGYDMWLDKEVQVGHIAQCIVSLEKEKAML